MGEGEVGDMRGRIPATHFGMVCAIAAMALLVTACRETAGATKGLQGHSCPR